MLITSLFKGDPNYISEQEVQSRVIATFSEALNQEDYYLTVTYGDIRVDIEANALKNPELADNKHLEFTIKVPCGQNYQYQIKRKDNAPIKVIAAYGEAEPHLHQAIDCVAPVHPQASEFPESKMVFYGDQEVMNAVQCTKIDDKVANLLSLDIAQPQLTVNIANHIQQFNPQIVVHGGDIMHGETLLKPKIKELDDFRAHLYEDVDLTLTDKLAAADFVLATDDHDDGQNNIDAKEIEKDSQAFANAVFSYQEKFPLPSSSIDDYRSKCYTTTYANVSYFVINGRLFNQPGQSVLGQAQLDWLENKLAESNSEYKFIVSSLPPVAGKSPNEDVRSNPQECERLFKIAAKYEVSGLLCADSHNYSRTYVDVPDGDYVVTIPVFVVGTGGGMPQELSKKERKQVPNSLLPDDLPMKGTLQAYYTAIDKPGQGISILGKDLQSPIPALFSFSGKKKYRAYQNGEWTGNNISKGQFGCLDIEFKKVENPQTHQMESKVFTHFWATRLKDKEANRKKQVFEDYAEIPAKPLRRAKLAG